jgi:hypothetical protein
MATVRISHRRSRLAPLLTVGVLLLGFLALLGGLGALILQL